jgi:DNA-binding CsgD family transcriptional regulator/PAS domain-containing protein
LDDNYQAVLNLIGEIYECSIDAAHWPVVMEQLAAITRAKSAVLVIHDREVEQLSFLHAYGVPRLGLALLNSPLGALDPGVRVMRNQTPGKARNMYRLDDPEKVPRLFYALVSRLTDLHYFGGVNCFNDEHWHVGIGLHRTREEGEFEPQMLALLEDLVPHFQRALRIQKAFARLQARQQALHAELDRHIIGLLLLDAEGRPRYSNPMAERILEHHPAVELRHGRLHAYGRKEDAQLQQALVAVRHPASGSDQRGHACGLTHPDHPMPLALLVLPHASGGVAVYLTDPEHTVSLAHDALMSVYGLTEKEARVAVAIANGKELGEIAELHHVSIQTVRSQLKSIFRKTGVNRQVDLIRLLLGGPLAYGG